jgi:hypothetical protein
MLNKILKNKKGAVELSIGTIVIIVLAMTMLILGLVLVRNVFSFGTDSVTSLSEKVKGEINNLFTKEGKNIAIVLGSNKLAKIEQGTKDFGIAIGAKRVGGVKIRDDSGIHLFYKLKFKDEGCRGKGFDKFIPGHTFNNAGNEGSETEYVEFDDIAADVANTIIFFDIPDGVGECTQKIEIITSESRSDSDIVESQSFRVQIISGGIFS